MDLQTTQVFSLCVTAPGIRADLELEEVSSEYLGAGWVMEPGHGALSACAWLLHCSHALFSIQSISL